MNAKTSPSLAPSPRVEALIQSVMARHKGLSDKAMARYYEDVHQVLAPLARELERELLAQSQLMDDMATLIRRMAAEIKKTSPDSDLAHKSLDFLHRNGQKAHVLRENTYTSSELDTGKVGLAHLGRLLIDAEKLMRDYKGMVISLPGALTHGARALNEMAEPPSIENSEALEAHEDRLVHVQPRFHAHLLEQIVNHLEKLKLAVESGNTEEVAAILRLYVLD